MVVEESSIITITFFASDYCNYFIERWNVMLYDNLDHKLIESYILLKKNEEYIENS